MWTFDNPPLKELQQKYHFTPTKQWLDHIRLSSVRLNDGGSGSFVSPHGLLLTNHHVARGQLQKNSTAGHDYIKNGFYAATEAEEIKSPDLEVNILISDQEHDNPGSTQRLDTVAQLQFQRDVQMPDLIQLLKSRIDVLEKYSARGAEQAREASTQIFGLQNSLKAYDGMYKGLVDPHIMQTKAKAESEFKALVASKPEWEREYGNAWSEIAAAEDKARTRAKQQYFRGTNSELANLAATIVDYVAEVKKPDGERLPGFHDTQLESLKFSLFSPAPVYPAMGSAAQIVRRAEAGR